jgi:hypothetical protein
MCNCVIFQGHPKSAKFQNTNPLGAGQTLADDFGVAVDENGHQFSSEA